MHKTRCLLLTVLVVGITATLAAQAGQKETPSASSQSASPQAVPVMDGGAGPCTLDLSVTTDGKPATVATTGRFVGLCTAVLVACGLPEAGIEKAIPPVVKKLRANQAKWRRRAIS